MAQESNPYAYNSSTDTPVTDSQTEVGVVNLAAYQNPSGRLAVTKGMFGFYLFVIVGSVVSSFMQIDLLSEVVNGAIQPDFDARVTANDQRELFVTSAQVIAFLLLAIASLMLLYRLRANVDHLGATELDYSPVGSIACFFVPIANLWRPRAATSQTWAASADPRSWEDRAVPGIINSWWAVWIFSCFYGQIGTTIVHGNNDQSTAVGLINTSWFAISSLVLEGISGTIYLLMLNDLTNVQQTTFEKLSTASTDVSKYAGVGPQY